MKWTIKIKRRMAKKLYNFYAERKKKSLTTKKKRNLWGTHIIDCIFILAVNLKLPFKKIQKIPQKTANC
jgi:hypothetical protein